MYSWIALMDKYTQLNKENTIVTEQLHFGTWSTSDHVPCQVEHHKDSY